MVKTITLRAKFTFYPESFPHLGVITSLGGQTIKRFHQLSQPFPAPTAWVLHTWAVPPAIPFLFRFDSLPQPCRYQPQPLGRERG